jgi:hypothetical protein
MIRKSLLVILASLLTIGPLMTSKTSGQGFPSVSYFSVFSSYTSSHCPFPEQLTYSARIRVTQESNQKRIHVSMCGFLNGNQLGPSPRTQFDFELLSGWAAGVGGSILLGTYPTTREDIPIPGSIFPIRLFRFSFNDEFMLENSTAADNPFLATSSILCQVHGLGNTIPLNPFGPFIGDLTNPFGNTRAYVAVPTDDKNDLQNALRASPYSGFANDPTIDCVFSDCSSITSFEASPSTIAPGGTATLAWDVSGLGSNRVRILPEVGIVTDPTRRNAAIRPNATTSYRLDIVDPTGNPIPCAGERQTVVSVVPTNRFFAWRVERRAPSGGPTPGYVYPPFESQSLQQFEASASQNPSLIEPFNSQAGERLRQWQAFDSDPNQSESLAGQFQQRLRDFNAQSSPEWQNALDEYNRRVAEYNAAQARFQAAHAQWEIDRAAYDKLYAGKKPGETVIGPVIDPTTNRPIRPKVVFGSKYRDIPKN